MELQTEYTYNQQELLDGIQLLLNIIQVRLGEQPLTVEEIDNIDTYNNNCTIHITTDRYCKACNGIIVAMTCKDGQQDVPTE